MKSFFEGGAMVLLGLSIGLTIGLTIGALAQNRLDDLHVRNGIMEHRGAVFFIVPADGRPDPRVKP